MRIPSSCVWYVLAIQRRLGKDILLVEMLIDKVSGLENDDDESAELVFSSHCCASVYRHQVAFKAWSHQ